jgi:hypothetical protein
MQEILLEEATAIELMEDWSPEKARAAWESLQARLKEHPIPSAGVRYTRDELHDRRRYEHRLVCGNLGARYDDMR